MSRSFEDIFYEKSEGVAKVTINRPEVMNAFRPKTIDEMVEAFKDAWEDDQTGVVVLTGAGDRAFCSGGTVGVTRGCAVGPGAAVATSESGSRSAMPGGTGVPPAGLLVGTVASVWWLAATTSMTLNRFISVSLAATFCAADSLQSVAEVPFGQGV